MLKLTIGICAHNDVKTIGVILSTFRKWKLGKHELDRIIVVTSECTDGTEKLVERAQEKDNRVHLIREPIRTGKATAVNKIIEASRGDIILLIAADILLPQSSIQPLLDIITADKTVGIVCGHPIPIERSGIIGYLSVLLWRLHHQTLLHESKNFMNTHSTGELMVIRKKAASTIPFFIVNDDAYLCISSLMKGFTTKYCPKAIVYIDTPKTSAKLLSQRRRIIFGHHQIRRIMKVYPKALEGLLFEKPSSAFNVLIKELRKSPKDSLGFLILIIIEMFANILALLDTNLGRSWYIWKRV